MEKMPFQEHAAIETVVSTVPLPTRVPAATDWRAASSKSRPKSASSVA